MWKSLTCSVKNSVNINCQHVKHLPTFQGGITISTESTLKTYLKQMNTQTQTMMTSETELKRLNGEMSAATRSMKTNLVLSVAFLFIFLSLSIFSDILNVLICSSLKGFVPILTTIANFGKIQHILLLYWQNFTESVFDRFRKFRLVY